MKKSIDWNAKEYKEFSSEQEKSGKFFVSTLPFRGDETVLDVGCGDGRTTEMIAARVPHGKVIGIDPSTNMIALAQKSFFNVKNLTFEQTGIEKFTTHATFDFIVSFHALHYVTDHSRALKNIYNALKPNGSFLAVMGSSRQEGMTPALSREPWKSHRKKTYNLPSEEEYLSLLEKTGFSSCLVKTIALPVTYPTKESLFKHLMIHTPFLTGRDEARATRICTELVKDIAEGKETDILVLWPILHVRASK